jgi:hypothetical protein
MTMKALLVSTLIALMTMMTMMTVMTVMTPTSMSRSRFSRNAS